MCEGSEVVFPPHIRPSWVLISANTLKKCLTYFWCKYQYKSDKSLVSDMRLFLNHSGFALSLRNCLESYEGGCDLAIVWLALISRTQPIKRSNKLWFWCDTGQVLSENEQSMLPEKYKKIKLLKLLHSYINGCAYSWVVKWWSEWGAIVTAIRLFLFFKGFH